MSPPLSSSVNNMKITTLYDFIKSNSVNGYKNFAILKIVFPQDEDTPFMDYLDRIDKHNKMFMMNPLHDSGFDLLVPVSTEFTSLPVTKFIDMRVKAEMMYCEVDADRISTSAYMLYPRSSISKTPLIMANHVGIIDSGYRGSLIGAFRNLGEEPYTVAKCSRLLQICHPSLCPIYVMICDTGMSLTDSLRGDGGFGSTDVKGASDCTVSNLITRTDTLVTTSLPSK